MKKSIKTMVLALTMVLSITTMVGCQSTATIENSDKESITTELELENKFTQEQIELFTSIYEAEHTEEQLELIGEEDVLFNEQALARGYIVLEVLPENGEELYMEWRNMVHP